ncbi:MAG: dipicolinate synthase subunit DpsA [Oscillospiraceae bacterium]
MGDFTFAVIGGDKRSAYLAAQLDREGCLVETVGLELSGIVPTRSIITLEGVLPKADCIILPLPLLGENGKLLQPFSSARLDIYSVIEGAKKGAVIFAGVIPPTVAEYAARCGVSMYDYYLREDLRIKNAVPTAEGAAEILMQQLPITIFGSRLLVIGFGKTAKRLCFLLAAMGAQITVSARRTEDTAYAESLGYNAQKTARLGEKKLRYDAIVNTVPALLFTPDVIDAVEPGTLIVDLASKPGGVDGEYAKSSGMNYIWALSLPGKVAPKTAGQIIKETIENMLAERGCGV